MDKLQKKIWTVGNCPIERPCSQTWDELEHDERYPRIGYCRHCDTNVFRCDNDDELDSHAALGRCVAVPVQVMTTGKPSFYLGGIKADYQAGEKLNWD